MSNPLRWLARSIVHLCGRVEIELLFWGDQHGIPVQSLPMRTPTFNIFLTDVAQWGAGHGWPGSWWALYCRGRIHVFLHPVTRWVNTGKCAPPVEWVRFSGT